MNAPRIPTGSNEAEEISQEEFGEDGLVEVGQVSATKGGLLGNLSDPSGNSWRPG